MTSHTFASLFTREALRPFQPRLPLAQARGTLNFSNITRDMSPHR